jgi:hypothetical protein
VKSLRNGANLGFYPGKGPAGHALVLGMEADAQQRTRRGQRGVYWLVAETQNVNSGLYQQLLSLVSVTRLDIWHPANVSFDQELI